MRPIHCTSVAWIAGASNGPAHAHGVAGARRPGRPTSPAIAKPAEWPTTAGHQAWPFLECVWPPIRLRAVRPPSQLATLSPPAAQPAWCRTCMPMRMRPCGARPDVTHAPLALMSSPAGRIGATHHARRHTHACRVPSLLFLRLRPYPIQHTYSATASLARARHLAARD